MKILPDMFLLTRQNKNAIILSNICSGDFMERSVLHCDANKFYASVECLYHPEIRDKPVVVGGNEETRHGIVLTGNEKAKKEYSIKTGMTLADARMLCPKLVVVPPDYPKYLRFSKMLRRIYSDYTDMIEPFGLDECWLDVSGSGTLYGSPEKIAGEIRKRVKFELGITVSVGVSWNKIFAKLGSDYKKPDAVTVINKNNFREIVYPLPISDLLMVGPATTRKLKNHGIYTVGELAGTPPHMLAAFLGKMGYIIHSFANGYENSPVAACGSSPLIKSVGNGITAPRDLTCEEDIKSVQYVLTESVARRLREQGLKGRVVSIGVRDKNLFSFTRQIKLPSATNDTRKLQSTALNLFNSNYSFDTMPPVRSLSVSVSELCDESAAFQLDMFEDNELAERLNRLNHTVDRLKDRFGSDCVRQAFLLKDRALTGFDPYGSNIIHPVSYFR